ncbi:hypothetical protein CRYUN_Cryun28dG0005300 [Craigia yunnanensis]
MRCMAWNCRRLGNPQAVRALKELIKKEESHVVFIREIELHVRKLDRIRRSCGMNACFGVSAIGSNSGLVMLWSEEVNLKLISFSNNHIDMEVDAGLRTEQWRITGFNGEPNASRREELWTLLGNLAKQVNKPWLCLGDLNEIL